jgi:hypothetical protein
MVQLSSDEVVVVAVRAAGDLCWLSIDGGETVAEFELRFRAVDGIRVLTGADPLTRWLMGKGQLWALPQIRQLADRAVSGCVPSLPLHLENNEDNAPRGA